MTPRYILLLPIFVLTGCATPTESAAGLDALHARGRWEACESGTTWYEMPLTTRIDHGRPIQKTNGRVADAFVCRGTLRWESTAAPSTEVQWLFRAAIADAELRSVAILLTLKSLPPGPTRVCEAFQDYVNQKSHRELGRSQRVFFELRSAFAELEGGERWMEDPDTEYFYQVDKNKRPLLGPDEPLPRCQALSSGEGVTR